MFIPDQVSGLFAWYMASSVTGVSNGGTVSLWKDSSGSGNNLINGTGVVTYMTNAINGYPTIQFNGAVMMSTGTSVFISPSSLAVYTVYNVTNSLLGAGHIIASIGSPYNLTNDVFNIGYNDENLGASSSQIFSVGLPSGNTAATFTLSSASVQAPTDVFMVRSDKFLTNLASGIGFATYYNNNQFLGVVNDTISQPGPSGANIFLGGNQITGREQQNGFFGQIAEILMYDAPKVSNSNNDLIINYLSNKYGLGSTLTLFLQTETPAFTPSGINGLFAWYEPGGVVGGIPGSSITSWQDFSGSGNHLTPNSSLGPAPTYHTNVIAGYPTIRFSGGGYLQTLTHNQSLEISPSSLSIYCVYRTQDCYLQQVFFANDHFINGANKNTCFQLGLNPTPITEGPLYASGWYYAWGHVGLSPNNKLNLTVLSSGVQPGTQFTLRADTFSQNSVENPWNPNGAGFYFNQFNNAIAASSVADTLIDTSSLLYMGNSATTELSFNGDIAELLAFDFNTVDTTWPIEYDGTTNLHEIIIDYLNEKYFQFNQNSFSLYINAAASGTSGQTTLYTGSMTNAIQDITLYIGSTTHTSGNFTLAISGLGVSNPSITLYALGQISNISGVPIDLFINGIPSGEFGPLTMFMHGISSYSSGIPLYINNVINNDISMYVYGVAVVPPSSGTQVPFTMPLFTFNQAPPSITGTVPLFMSVSQDSGASGLYRGTTLFMNAGSTIGTMPLYLGVNPPGTPQGFLPLFTSGPITTGVAVKGVNLYVNNLNQLLSQGAKLYTEGLGTLNGGLIDSETMPLFINSPQINLLPFFIYGSNIITEGLPLSISGVLNNVQDIPLYVGSFGSPTISGVSLYGLGNNFIDTKVFNLYVSGVPVQNIPMVMYERGF